MKITKISTSHTETVSLPNYNNIKHSVFLEAIELDPDTHITHAIEELQAEATAAVQIHIDAEMIERGLSPYFFKGPRYSAYRDSSFGIILILPDSVNPTYLNHLYDGGFIRDFPISTANQPLNVLTTHVQLYCKTHNERYYVFADTTQETLPECEHEILSDINPWVLYAINARTMVCPYNVSHTPITRPPHTASVQQILSPGRSVNAYHICKTMGDIEQWFNTLPKPEDTNLIEVDTDQLLNALTDPPDTQDITEPTNENNIPF